VFVEFRRRLETLTNPEEKAFCTDLTLIRYLRARDFDLSKSEALLRATLAWRFTDYKPHLIDPRSLREEALTGKNYVSRFKDRHGRPIVYMKPRYENTKDYPNQIRLLVYHMERTVDMMEEEKGIHSWVWIIDYKEFSMKNAPPLSTSLESTRSLCAFAELM